MKSQVPRPCNVLQGEEQLASLKSVKVATLLPQAGWDWKPPRQVKRRPGRPRPQNTLQAGFGTLEKIVQIFFQMAKWWYLWYGPLPVTVTTRIITFLVGNPYKPSFATVTGWGVDLNDTSQEAEVYGGVLVLWWRWFCIVLSISPLHLLSRSLWLRAVPKPWICVRNDKASHGPSQKWWSSRCLWKQCTWSVQHSTLGWRTVLHPGFCRQGAHSSSEKWWSSRCLWKE